MATSLSQKRGKNGGRMQLHETLILEIISRTLTEDPHLGLRTYEILFILALRSSTFYNENLTPSVPEQIL